MKIIVQYIIAFCCGCILLFSCSVSNSFPAKYYQQNENDLTEIESLYKTIDPHHPLSVAFTNKEFEIVSLEMKTDSLRYIYEFSLNDPAMKDSLLKYGYNATVVLKLLHKMKQIKCTWINSLEYNTEKNKQILTFMSIRHKALEAPFSSSKYFILTFYEQRQYYDENGLLLDRRNVRRLRKINNEIFHRITDKVCYTLSAKFR